MHQSITIILPVKDVADCFARRVDEMLNCVTAICENTQLLVVDHQSSDATLDIAKELSQENTRVRVAGSVEAARRAQGGKYGEIVLIHADIRKPISDNTLDRLRHLCGEAEARQTLHHSAEASSSLVAPTIRGSKKAADSTVDAV